MAVEQTYPLHARSFSLSPWLAIVVGMAAMYVPSFIDLFHGAWGTERNGHGPIVLVVACCYLYVRVRQLLAEGLIERKPAPLAGALMLLFGLLCFALGRSQTVLLLEAGSLIPVLAGIILVFFGTRTCARLWFAFFFMLFMVPLPASIVDFLTQPLKIGVSYASEHLLYALGYPIARNGVILVIGQYQLLVADACAGLNSLFTLEALGLLYMNLVRHQSLMRNTVLALLIVPISFTANTIRVVALALITYYLGDAAGQGFLHGFAGMLLFMSALLLIMGVDSLLRMVVSYQARRKGLPEPEAMPAQFRKAKLRDADKGLFAISLKPAVLLALGMLVSVLAVHMLTPQLAPATKMAKFDSFVPKQFGDWREVPSPYLQVSLSVEDGTDRSADPLYDDVLSRTYVNSKGEQIMLALAYAREQQQDVKIHLPEVCYVAQGFALKNQSRLSLEQAAGKPPVTGHRFLAQNKNRLEAVSYWVRIGNAMPDGALATRLKIFRDGMSGIISDGILVRASSLLNDPEESADAYALQQRFLSDFENAMNGPHPGLLVPA
ncbi:exosortase B [Herbaspirillum lusitanum]|jgi:exosortase B|uniref:Exosortase B n=1 Tax=Herbaspirillum lusitanum TaxID=213312 RepID=A0ABW9A5L1_9BURK